jgi:hypothetical protein
VDGAGERRAHRAEVQDRRARVGSAVDPGEDGVGSLTEVAPGSGERDETRRRLHGQHPRGPDVGELPLVHHQPAASAVSEALLPLTPWSWAATSVQVDLRRVVDTALDGAREQGRRREETARRTS